MIYVLSTLRRCLGASLLALLATLAIYLVFDLIEHLRILLAYKADSALLADLALARIPLAVYHLLPVAILLGGLAVMAEMARDREVLALAAAGQGMARRVFPFVLAGLVVALLTWGLSENLTPAAEARYRDIVDIQIKKKHRWGAAWRPHRTWYAGPSGLWRVGKGSGSHLEDVTLYRTLGEAGYGRVEHYADLRHDGETWWASAWRSEDASRRKHEEEQDVAVDLKEAPEHFQMIWAQAAEMTREELEGAVALRALQGLEADGYRTELATRWAIPLLCLMLPLVLPLSAWRPSRIGRQRGRLATLGEGIGFGLVFFLILTAGRALASAGVLSPLPALLAAPFLALCVGLVGLRRAV